MKMVHLHISILKILHMIQFDMLVYNEEGNEWIVVACQKGGIVESYRFGKEKGGQVYETEYSCMVNEPICLTPFINNF